MVEASTGWIQTEADLVEYVREVHDIDPEGAELVRLFVICFEREPDEQELSDEEELLQRIRAVFFR